MTRRCTTCFREERDGELLAEGGGRRPAVPVPLARWRAWKAARAGETAPVVAICPGCDVVMVGDGPALPELDLGGGMTARGDTVIGGTEERLEALAPYEPPPIVGLLIGAIVSGAVFGCWALAVVIVVFFLYAWFTQP